MLHEISERLGTADGFHEVLNRVVEFASALVKCDSCLIYILEGDELVLRASKNPHPEAVDRLKLRVGQGITGWVAEHREPVAIRKRQRTIRASSFFTSCRKIVRSISLGALDVPGTRGWRDQLAASPASCLPPARNPHDLDRRISGGRRDRDGAAGRCESTSRNNCRPEKSWSVPREFCSAISDSTKSRLTWHCSARAGRSASR